MLKKQNLTHPKAAKLATLGVIINTSLFLVLLIMIILLRILILTFISLINGVHSPPRVTSDTLIKDLTTTSITSSEKCIGVGRHGNGVPI